MKRKVIVSILAILFVVAIAMFFLFTGKETVNNNPTPVPTSTPVETPTVEPTNTPMAEPTTEPIITDAPVEVPTEGPAEPTTEPTVTVAPTEVPTVAPVATPTAVPTPTFTPTPVPTSTPMPSPTPLVEYKIDGKDVEIVQTFKVSETTYIYVYENGNTGIADTKTGYTAKYGTKFESPKNVDVTTVVGKVKHVLEDNNISFEPQYLPTPTPTPTPFPTPNPDKPKKLASCKGDKNYGDVTMEIWDNGYMYITGTGTFNTNAVCGLGYTAPDFKEFIRIYRLSGVKTTYYIVGEGITALDDWGWLSPKLKYIEFPFTLETVDLSGTGLEDDSSGLTLVGYKDGQKVTYECKEGDDFSKVLKEQFGINSK